MYGFVCSNTANMINELIDRLQNCFRAASTNYYSFKIVDSHDYCQVIEFPSIIQCTTLQIQMEFIILIASVQGKRTVFEKLVDLEVGGCGMFRDIVCRLRLTGLHKPSAFYD